MHAVTFLDERMEWAEHPDPRPGSNELLVAVRAAGLNGADMAQRRGGYPAPPGVPANIPGLELAGEVIAVGDDVQRFRVGDRVMTLVAGGAQAELAVVHERVAMAVPPGISWANAGGFPEVFVTAHDALFSQCGLALGERVLVHGAAGGVGIAAVQLAARAGAHVVATVRRADVRARVAEIGQPCGDVEVVAPEDFEQHGPFDVVLELVGAPNLAADIQSLDPYGRVIVIGVGAGAKVELDLMRLMQRRGRILASTLRARSLEEKAIATREVEHHVLPALERGAIRVPVAAEYAMRDAERAYDAFTAGGKVGKIVLHT